MLNFDMAKFLEKEFKCKKSGNNLVFCCTFCQDKSYNYWFDIEKEYIHKRTKKTFKGLGRCFRCERHHSVLTFLMEYKKKDMFSILQFMQGDNNLSTKDLLQMLHELNNDVVDNLDSLMSDFQNEINIDIPPGSSTNLPPALIEWFEGNGVVKNDGLFLNQRYFPKELLKLLKVEYCWDSHKYPFKEWSCGGHKMMLGSLRNRAIFPIETGKSKAWQAYLFHPGKSKSTGEAFAKTRNPPGPIMQSLLFLYEHVKNEKVILGNEGIFDALRSLSRGYSPVGFLGKNLSFTQAYLISKTKAQEFCMCLDGGEREFVQALKNCLKLEEMFEGEITIMRLPDGIDPDDCSEKVFHRAYANRKTFEQYKLNTETSKMISNLKVSTYNGYA